jgi:two-component system response regulator (stage 0 sporulation protein A)
MNGYIISNTLRSIGITANLKGYHYIRDAVLIVLDSDDKDFSGITKAVYPTLARKYGTSPANIERNIRSAIRIAYSRCPYDTFSMIVSIPNMQDGKLPTNTYNMRSPSAPKNTPLAVTPAGYRFSIYIFVCVT